MNLSHYYECPPQTGRTTALVKAVKRKNGFLVCANRKHAEQMERLHGVNTLTPADLPFKTEELVLFDHYTTATFLRQKEMHIEQLEETLRKQVNRNFASAKLEIELHELKNRTFFQKLKDLYRKPPH